MSYIWEKKYFLTKNNVFYSNNVCVPDWRYTSQEQTAVLEQSFWSVVVLVSNLSIFLVFSLSIFSCVGNQKMETGKQDRVKDFSQEVPHTERLF